MNDHYLVLVSGEAIRSVQRNAALEEAYPDLDPAIDEAGWCGTEFDGKRFAVVAIGATNEALQEALAFVQFAL